MLSCHQQRWLKQQLLIASDPHPEFLGKTYVQKGLPIRGKGLHWPIFEGNQKKGKIFSVNMDEKVKWESNHYIVE